MNRKIKLNGSNEICRSVERSLDEYFKRLDGETPTGVYDMVIGHVERALLVSIMERANGNQTQAADMLGMNRNTLRVKLDPLQADLMAARVAQALLSVSDKTGLVEFARGLAALGVELLSTGRHREGAGRRRPARHRCRYLHGLSGNARWARQDAASEGARRHPGAPRSPGARRGARGARHPDHRPGRRQPLSVPRDRRQARLHAGRRHREHRHRRTVDGARRSEELAARRHRRRPGGLRGRACRTELGRRRADRCVALSPDAQGVRAHGVLRWRHRQLADGARS